MPRTGSRSVSCETTPIALPWRIPPSRGANGPRRSTGASCPLASRYAALRADASGVIDNLQPDTLVPAKKSWDLVAIERLARGIQSHRYSSIAPCDAPKVQPNLVGDSASFVMGDQVHDHLQEMNREVFAGRDADLITVGETPGGTVDDAIRFTSSLRLELDMVFPFEHVHLDHGPSSTFHVRQPAGQARGSEALARAVADRPRRFRVAQSLLQQPRPAVFGLPVSRRRRLPVRVRDAACSHPAPSPASAPRHTLPPSAWLDRHDHCRLDRHRAVPGNEVAEQFRRGGGGRSIPHSRC